MEYVAIAFRSRSDTVAFYKYLAFNGIRSEIINTPKEAGVGCGLSVKVSRSVFSVAKRAVFAFNRKSFAGFFLVRTLNGRRTVASI